MMMHNPCAVRTLGLLLLSSIYACTPVLRLKTLRSHPQPDPAAIATQVVERSAEDRPAWMSQETAGRGIPFVGQGHGPDLSTARERAEQDLQLAATRYASAAVQADFEDVETFQNGKGEHSVRSEIRTTMENLFRALTPSAFYWEKVARGDGEVAHYYYAHARVLEEQIAQARVARHELQRSPSVVLLPFSCDLGESLMAETRRNLVVERKLDFVDPALVRALAGTDVAAVRQKLPNALVVAGTCTKEKNQYQVSYSLHKRLGVVTRRLANSDLFALERALIQTLRRDLLEAVQ